MIALYLLFLVAMSVLSLSYRYAAEAPGAPVWLKRLPVPAWGNFFIYAGLMAVSCLGIFTFMMQSMFVPSASMAPGLQPGQTILVKPAAFGVVNPFTGTHLTDGNFNSLQRGDVVLAKFAYNADVRYIKRVVALPGDTISVSPNGYTINGQAVPFTPTDDPLIYDVALNNHRYQIKIDPEKTFLKQSEVEVPAGYVYMLGDNLTKSSDSRDLGFIPIHNIIARPY
jgi:signal peptidase I